VLEPLEGRDCPSGGLLDPTFGSGGIVNLPNATDNGATAVAVQPDGKVVVAGYVTRNTGSSSISVQRLNRDGSLDTTFNKTGSVTIQTDNDDTPRAVALQPDGRILVGGSWSGHNGSGGGLVARLNMNGSLDTTFGSRGLWKSAVAGRVNKLAVLTDPLHPASVTGIVAAVDATVNGVGCLGAVKLTPAGQSDNAFGSAGFAAFPGLTAPDDGRTAGVAVAPSGEVYLAGHVQLAGMTLPDGCLVAVTPSGSLDPAFAGGAGYVLADPTGNSESAYYGVAVQTLTVGGQPVSRVVVAGYVTTHNYDAGIVSAYTLGGALDTTFGSGGSFIYANQPGQESTLFYSLALATDGSIVVGGEHNTYGPGGVSTAMLVGHLSAAGTADTSFGTAGTGFVVVADGRSSLVRDVAIDPADGSIVAAGWTYITNARQAAIVRLTAP
jgi:uncharacterized delta-60 repeat protein